jgi:hypothetical protein
MILQALEPLAIMLGLVSASIAPGFLLRYSDARKARNDVR